MREILQVLAVADALEATDLVVAELAPRDDPAQSLGRDMETLCDRVEIVQPVVGWRGRNGLVVIGLKPPRSVPALWPLPHHGLCLFRRAFGGCPVAGSSLTVRLLSACRAAWRPRRQASCASAVSVYRRAAEVARHP